MKLTGIFVFLALTMCCFSGVIAQQRRRTCVSPGEDVIKCPPAEALVCGSDGKTYKNICVLGKAIRAACGKIRFIHTGKCVVQQTP